MSDQSNSTSSRVLLLLFLSVFVDLIGFGIIAPLLPFIAERYGANPLGVTLLFSLYSLMQLVSVPLWGGLSDRVGRRPILLMSYGGSAIAYVLFAFAPTLALIFAARALAGIMGSSITVAKAYIADITTPENRAKGMGVIGAAFGCGFMIGPALGGVLAGTDPQNPNVQLPLLVAAGLSLVAFTFALVALPESLKLNTANAEPAPTQAIGKRIWGEGAPFNPATIAKVLRPTRIRQLVGVLFLFSLATVGVQAVLVLWCERQFGWGPRTLGFVFMFYGVIATIIQGGLTGKLTRRFKEKKLLTAGIAFQGFGLLLVPLSSTPVLLIASTSFWVIGEAISRPAISSLLSQSAPPEQQGITLGVAQSFTSLANVSGPIVAGALFTVFGGQWAFWGASGLMAIAAIVGMAIHPKPPFGTKVPESLG